MSRLAPLALLLLAAVTLGLAGCPARPQPVAGPPRRVAAPVEPVRVLLELPAAERYVQLLGVDRRRREAHLLATASGPPSAIRLVTVPLDVGRPVATFALPADAVTWLEKDRWWSGYDRARRTPWLVRLLDAQRSAGPWYMSRQPPLVDVDPSGAWMVLRSSADYIDLVPTGAGGVRRLNGDSPACYQPAFSPDGRFLAYSCFSRTHHEYCPTFLPVTGDGRPRQRCESRGYAASGPYWRPDSRAFLVLAKRGFGAYVDPEHRLCPSVNT